MGHNHRNAMASQKDVRRIALALPGVREAEGRFAFAVESKGKEKGFAWSWRERVDPRKARVPRPDVLAVRVRNGMDKAMLLAGDPERFFTEPHYNGFPAVLVRLRAVTAAQLRPLLAEAWRCVAPRALVEKAAETGKATTRASRADRRGTPSRRASTSRRPRR
jgi:hypothetical protein